MTTASQSPVEIVRLFMKDMERLDYDSALKRVSDDCEYLNPAAAARRARPGRDPQPAGAVLRTDPSKMSSRCFAKPPTDPGYSSSASIAIASPTSGSSFPVTGVFEVHDGRITFWRDYFDAADDHVPMAQRVTRGSEGHP